jgi:hypothetical protein
MGCLNSRNQEDILYIHIQTLNWDTPGKDSKKDSCQIGRKGPSIDNRTYLILNLANLSHLYNSYNLTNNTN